MPRDKLREKLFEAIEEIKVVDCHEHLPPESVRVARKVDLFTLFSHYTKGDLARAGMAENEIQLLSKEDISLDSRWRLFAPFWEKIRYTSYSRAVLIAIRKFYGENDINQGNYQKISERMKEMNQPGIYQRILKEAGGIQVVLTQCGRTRTESELLKPIMPLTYPMETSEELLYPPFAAGRRTGSLDDYLESCRRYLLQVKKEGAVGLKLMTQPFGPPSRRQALSFFKRIITGKAKREPPRRWPTFPLSHPLLDYITEEMVNLAGKENLVVAVHTGYWGDFRRLHPLHLIPLLQRHPETRFDIYHCGYPWVRETLMLAKGFSNVWLNFCWTHIISQKFATESLDEALDLLPNNKILAFGGDYRDPVEKVYGHLVMAREDIVQLLSTRIRRGSLKENEALRLARLWFYDNPVSLYRLTLSTGQAPVHRARG
ncbi:MAG: amidohydrolase [Candidatus Omnitrophica bacterium]|nr:amidohydrolase [Candidatus Omnitrophota bacterium]